MEMFFDWRKRELESLTFLATLIISLTLSLCLSMMIFVALDYSNLIKSLISGVMIILTICIAFEHHIKYVIFWCLFLTILIESILYAFIMDNLLVIGFVLMDVIAIFLLWKFKYLK